MLFRAKIFAGWKVSRSITPFDATGITREEEQEGESEPLDDESQGPR